MAYVVPTNFAAGAVLTEAQLDVLGNDIVFLANPPKCRVYNNANISIGSSADTALTFNTETFDTDTMHSTSVNTGRITFTTAGTYLVGGQVDWAPNSSGSRQVYIRRGGATPLAYAQTDNAGASSSVDLVVSTLMSFSAGEYVELVVWQNSGGNLNVQNIGITSPVLWAVWVSL